MRFKVVPPARDVAFLAAVQGALPLVPDDEESCCARVVRATDVPARDEAKEWITFLRALGLAEETSSGYHRLDRDPDAAELADAFRERVHGAEELLAVLDAADGPLAVEEALDRFELPEWERRRHADADRIRRERVERLLGWAAAFGLAERTADGYAIDAP